MNARWTDGRKTGIHSRYRRGARGKKGGVRPQGDDGGRDQRPPHEDGAERGTPPAGQKTQRHGGFFEILRFETMTHW